MVDTETTKPMSDQEIQASAQRLQESVTPAAIAEWLDGWQSMSPEHAQYPLRADQIRIGERALVVGNDRP